MSAKIKILQQYQLDKNNSYHVAYENRGIFLNVIYNTSNQLLFVTTQDHLEDLPERMQSSFQLLATAHLKEVQIVLITSIENNSLIS